MHSFNTEDKTLMTQLGMCVCPQVLRSPLLLDTKTKNRIGKSRARITLTYFRGVKTVFLHSKVDIADFKVPNPLAKESRDLSLIAEATKEVLPSSKEKEK